MTRINIKDNGIYTMQDDDTGILCIFPNFMDIFDGYIQSNRILQMNDLQTIIIAAMAKGQGSITDNIANIIAEMPMQILSLPGYADFLYESCRKHLN